MLACAGPFAAVRIEGSGYGAEMEMGGLGWGEGHGLRVGVGDWAMVEGLG